MDISIRIGNVIYTYVKSTNVVARDTVQYSYVQAVFYFQEYSGCVLQIIVSLVLVPKALNVIDVKFYNYELLVSKLTLFYKNILRGIVIH